MIESVRSILPDLVKHLGARLTVGLAAFGGAIWLVAERPTSEVESAAALIGGSLALTAALVGRSLTDRDGKPRPQPEVTDNTAIGE